MMKPTVPKLALPKVTLSIGGHRSLTILVVSLTLFIAACVYFVNTVVLSQGSDAAYQSAAEAKADQITVINTSALKQAQAFSANATNTTLPSGRINPFGS